MVRTGLAVVGLIYAVLGLWMVADPMGWYRAVPGVSGTGPMNHHFITDAGLAYLASGMGLLLGLRGKPSSAAFALAGAAWPLLHAGFHVWGWLAHGVPAAPDAAFGEAFGVVGLALISLAFACARTVDDAVALPGFVVRAGIGRMERHYGYDAGYLRDLRAAAPEAFTRFTQIQLLGGRWRGGAPRRLWPIAGVAGALVEDCGPCVQISTDIAIEEGVSASTLAALLSGAPADADALLVFDYARALLNHTPELDALRQRIEAKWGRSALLGISLRAMTGRNFPVMKRAMGHAAMCQNVRILDAEIAVDPRLKGA